MLRAFCSHNAWGSAAPPMPLACLSHPPLDGVMAQLTRPLRVNCATPGALRCHPAVHPVLAPRRDQGERSGSDALCRGPNQALNPALPHTRRAPQLSAGPGLDCAGPLTSPSRGAAATDAPVGPLPHDLEDTAPSPVERSCCSSSPLPGRGPAAVKDGSSCGGGKGGREGACRGETRMACLVDTRGNTCVSPSTITARVGTQCGLRWIEEAGFTAECVCALASSAA